MSSLTRIGIIGQGFVGQAVKEGFNNLEVYTYDKYKPSESTCLSLEKLLKKSNIIFVCVPTPMNLDGSCNLDTVFQVVSEADRYANNNHIFVIKSTIPPGTTDDLNKTTKNATVLQKLI